jgi:predicted aspartyl protease
MTITDGREGRAGDSGFGVRRRRCYSRSPCCRGDWPATIDTGFNSDLELPEALRSSVNPRFMASSRFFLAGGQSVVEDVYLIVFPFDGLMLEAETTFIPDADVLVGTGLLRRHKLEIDFPSASVRLERPL